MWEILTGDLRYPITGLLVIWALVWLYVEHFNPR